MATLPLVIPVSVVATPVPDPAAVFPPVPVVSVPASAVVVFVLTPGCLHADDIVNLSPKSGRDIYNKATVAIAIVFDGNSKRSISF